MSKTKIAVFGDAVAAGTSAKLDVFHDCFQYGTTTVNMVRESQTWGSILARILTDWVEDDVEVINAGVSGDTSSEGLARLAREVLAQSPDIVLVLFGAEDALAGVEIEAFRKNLKMIVDEIAAHNARPVLMTPTPVSERMTATGCTLREVRRRQERLSALARSVRKLAEEKSVDLIDLHRFFLDTRLAYDHLYEGWLPDGVAQSGMASFVAGELLDMLGVKTYPKPVLCGYRKAYSDAENGDTWHNAFTDLTYYQGEFFLAFHTGKSHGAPVRFGKEALLILRSPDAVTWVTEAVLRADGRDYRDAKLLVAGDRLMAFGACAEAPRPPGSPMVTYFSERLAPGRWSKPRECGPGVFWRAKKWRGKYVVASHGTGDPNASVKLFSSADGRTWEETSIFCEAAAMANETDLWVEGDTLTAFSRAGERNDDLLISTYIPSEDRWDAVSCGRLIHAPCVFKLGNSMMVAGRYCSQSDEGFRDLKRDWNAFNYGAEGESLQVDPARVEAYHHGLRTGIFVLDGARPRLVMELLSAGDSSYTGVVQYGDETVISDYSMHEYYPKIERPGDWSTPCDIYVSRIRFG